MRRSLSALLVLGTLLALAGVSLAVAYIVTADRPTDAATVLGTVVGVVGAATAAIRWLWSRTAARPGDALLDDRVERLAQALADEWADEAHSRRLIAPEPVQLRWILSEQPYAGALAGALRPAPAGLAPPEVPGVAAPEPTALAGAQPLDRLHGLYAGLPSGRLVVVGGEGTGKTSALVLLLLAALRHREGLPPAERCAVPVPVIVTLSSWNPRAQTLPDLVAESLLHNRKFLRGPLDAEDDLATALVKRGRVALFLDGLDEMPGPARAVALRAIDGLTNLRIVVSTRPDEYDEAARRSPFHRSAVVELLPVSPADSAAYLVQEHAPHRHPGWEAVAQELLVRPDSPLARALGTPLMLTLARDAYPPGCEWEPVELADRRRFPKADAIERHLIDRMLARAYPHGDDEPAARRRYPEGPSWLGHIARRMAGSELMWPDISHWVHPWVSRLWWGVVFGLITSAATLVALAPSSLAANHAAVAAAWAVGGASTYVAAATIDQRITRLPVAGLAFGIAGGGLVGLLVGLAFGLWLATTTAPLPALALGLAGGAAAGVGIAVAFVGVGLRNARMAARRQWPATLGRGAVARPSAFLVLAIAVAFARFSAPESGSLAVGVAVVGISIGLLGDILMSSQIMSSSGDARHPAFPTPEASLRRDLATWAVFGVVLGVGNALIFGFVFGSGVPGGLGWFGVSFLIALASSHASAFALAVTVLWASRRGPLRLLRFLRDAHERQVLRRVGWAYQFRHSRLQDRLAERYGGAEGGVGPDPSPTRTGTHLQSAR